MTKKKLKTVDDIVNEYHKFHHMAGKSFKERMGKLEDFHDPDNIHAAQFSHHAHYTLFGKPGKDKEYPGAYNQAHLALDGHVKDDAGVLNDESKLTEILETYVDTFLEKAMSGTNFKEILKHAEEEGMSKEKIRELKGKLMGRFHTDEKGNPQNILSEEYIQGLKGKNKLALIDELRGISEEVKKSYTSHLQQKALDGLISEDDRLDVAKYISPIFKKKGLKHKDSQITRSAKEQALHYSLLLQGASETLIKQAGYKPLKLKKDEEN